MPTRHLLLFPFASRNSFRNELREKPARCLSAKVDTIPLPSPQASLGSESGELPLGLSLPKANGSSAATRRRHERALGQQQQLSGKLFRCRSPLLSLLLLALSRYPARPGGASHTIGHQDTKHQVAFKIQDRG